MRNKATIFPANAITRWFKPPPRPGRPVGSRKKRGRLRQSETVPDTPVPVPAAAHISVNELEQEEEEEESPEERHVRQT